MKVASDGPYNACHAQSPLPNWPSSCQPASLQEFVLGRTLEWKYRQPLNVVARRQSSAPLSTPPQLPQTLTELSPGGASASLSHDLARTRRGTARLTLEREQWVGRSERGSSVRASSDSWPRCEPWRGANFSLTVRAQETSCWSRGRTRRTDSHCRSPCCSMMALSTASL